MPNHIYNRLTITGSRTTLNTFIVENSDPSNKEFGGELALYRKAPPSDIDR